MAATLPAHCAGRFMPEESLLRRSVKAAKAGDVTAFEWLVRQHEGMVLRTAQKLLAGGEDAKDAAQEVFLRLHRNLPKFREEQELVPWLYRMTVNICLDTRRRAKHQGEGFDGGHEPLDSRRNPEESASLAQQNALLQAALEQLSPKERAAVVLRDLEGCRTAEVAQILGSSEATVRSQISTGRIKIRSFLLASGKRTK